MSLMEEFDWKPLLRTGSGVPNGREPFIPVKLFRERGLWSTFQVLSRK
jgi:hypothetical protein